MKKFFIFSWISLFFTCLGLAWSTCWLFFDDRAVRQERELYFAAGAQWGATALAEHPGINFLQQTRIGWEYFQSFVRYQYQTGRDWKLNYAIPDSSYGLRPGTPEPNWEALEAEGVKATSQ